MIVHSVKNLDYFPISVVYSIHIMYICIIGLLNANETKYFDKS